MLRATGGYCGGDNNGKNLFWDLTEGGKLTIRGNGKMQGNRLGSPWNGNSELISTVVFNGNVTNIDSYAFHDCTDLTTIVIPNSVTIIEDRAFLGCKSLCEITIPDSVTSIGDYAFCDSGLTSIMISESIKRIGENPFFGCKSLASISVSTSNPSYCDMGGVLFTKSMEKLVAYPAGNKETSYSIPACVKSIGEYAFGKCENLASIILPMGITDIGFQAFVECTRLISVKIPNSVTCIEPWTFAKCQSLKTVTIPTSVCKIDLTSFSGVYDFKIIGCKGTYVEEYAYANGIHFVALVDLDDNGEFDNNDILIILNYIKGTTTLTPEQQKVADANDDGKVDIRDFNTLFSAMTKK